jgi:hypothetical protein
MESPIKAAARTTAELIIKLCRHHNDNLPSALSRHQHAIKIITNIYKKCGKQPPREFIVTTPQLPALQTTPSSVKRQSPRSMEMFYFCIADQVPRKQFDVKWHPGQEHLGNYHTKNHPKLHHARVHPFYLLEPNSPLELPCTMTPEDLRGCAKRAARVC